MATFTDENSALGDLNNRVKILCCLPAMFGAFISFGAYLIVRDTDGYGLWLPAALFVGNFDDTVFLVRKGRTNAYRGDDSCLSSTAAEAVKPDLSLWLYARNIRGVSRSFRSIELICDPVFAMYLD